MTNRNIIVLSDSYGAESITGATPFFETAKSLLSGKCSIYGYAIPGGNFANWGKGISNADDRNFAKMIKLITGITNPNSITDVVVMGGFNDRGQNNEDIVAGAKALKDYVNKQYPNAKISVGHIGWSSIVSSVEREKCLRSIKSYRNLSCLGFGYMANSEYIMHDYTLFISDNVHPNKNGCVQLAEQLVKFIINGTCDVHYSLRYIPSSNFAPNGAYNTKTDYNVGARLDNDTITLYLQLGEIKWNKELALSVNKWDKLIQLTCTDISKKSYFMGNYDDAPTVRPTFELIGYHKKNDGTFVSFDNTLFNISGGFLCMKQCTLNNARTSFAGLSGVQSTTITGGVVRIPTLDV